MGDQQPLNLKLLNILPEKVVEKAYDDGISRPAQQLGRLSEDTLKALRLFTAPFQLLGAFQDRFQQWTDQIRSSVPPERQTESPPEIAGPVIERLKYIDDENPLKELYLNLLTRSIDKQRQSEAHPAFIRVIEQLSPDEAHILAAMAQFPEESFQIHKFTVVFFIANPPGTDIETRLSPQDILPSNAIAFPERLELYLAHLGSLSLISYGRVLTFSID